MPTSKNSRKNSISTSRRANKALLFICALFVIALLASCASIDQKSAEQHAVDFVRANVKFYSQDEQNVTDLAQYSIDRVSSYEQDKSWHVAIHISSMQGNETKQNDLLVTIDKKGNPTSLNGKQIPRQ